MISDFYKWIDKTWLSGRDSKLFPEKTSQKFIADPYFPFLVSFPRTGSHWLRLMLELYFKKPVLVRAFFYQHPFDFLAYHTHDHKLEVQNRKNVIYLYRDPIPTIFSQMKYMDENLFDDDRIYFWSEAYAKHLKKWLVDEQFTEKKTLIKYENLKQHLHSEFEKICMHFDKKLKPVRLDKIAGQVSKEQLKEKSGHDTKVINNSSEYQKIREKFIREKGPRIQEYFRNKHPELIPFLDAE